MGTGLAALALGLATPLVGKRALAQPSSRLLAGATRPILDLSGVLGPAPRRIGGYWFAPRFDGDWPEIMSHPPLVPDAEPGEPDESAEVVIIGGGLSGLSCAYHLRDRTPIILERLPRFGGAAQGERWRNTEYSLGSAYFIAPDKGSSLESLYLELGVDKIVRVDQGESPAELNAALIEDFWTWAGIPESDRPAFEAYRALVMYYAKNYPEIPLPDAEDNQWIYDLDARTLKDDIEAAIGGPAPTLLAAAVQSYCYSSFGAGWEELSAASGWNFIAAEEFGRWVLPGGNSMLAEKLWERLQAAPGVSLRASCDVVAVRLNGDHVLVTYDSPNAHRRTIRAERVIFACPKYVAKFILRDLGTLDEEKLEAFQHIEYRPYVVANVLLNTPLKQDFYDLFLLGDGVYPMGTQDAEAFSRPTDVVTGHFARAGTDAANVLTLYWPLPWDTARFTLTPNVKPLQTYAAALAPRLDAILKLLSLTPRSVDHVRLVRWGHAMPIARPGFIAEGFAEAARRPIADRIFFAEQDNWALPAVETCLLEAEAVAALIGAGLPR